MLELNAADFVGAFHELIILSSVLERDRDKPVPMVDGATGESLSPMRLADAPCAAIKDPDIGAALLRFIDCAKALDVEVSVIHGQALLESYKDIKCSIIERELYNLALNFNRALTRHQFLYIESIQKRELYVKSPSEFWGDEVWTVFSRCRPDMIEAMRCFALDRNTACVYHLFQVVEGGLLALARNMRVSTLKKPKKGPTIHDLEWKGIAKNMSDKLNSQVPRSKSAKDKLRERKAALDRFENVRNVRNLVSHPDEKEFTEQEANDFLAHVPAFMRQVVNAL